MTYPIIQTDRAPLIDSETYESMYERSMNEPEAFWAEQAETFIDWEKKWDKVSDIDFSKGKIAWFEGATLNVSYNCLDRITMVVIAHRLSTVQHYDFIYNVENGQIIDIGTISADLKFQSKLQE